MIHNFTLSSSNRQSLIDKINKLDCSSTLYTVNIYPRKNKRTLEQNSRYHKLVTELGKHLGYEHDEMHDLIRFKFLRNRVEIDGESLPLLKSTTKLTTKEMGELMEAIERWAAQLGFVWESTEII